MELMNEIEMKTKKSLPDIASFEDNKTELAGAYIDPDYTLSDGIPQKELWEACERLNKTLQDNSVLLRRAKLTCFILENIRLKIHPKELFVDGFETCNFLISTRNDALDFLLKSNDADVYADHKRSYESGEYTGDPDFGHNCPDWQTLLALGVPGIITQAAEYLKKESLSPKTHDLYESVFLVYTSIQKLLLRYATIVRPHSEGNTNMEFVAVSLEAIARHRPENTHQALLLEMIIYNIMLSVTGNIPRTLGRLDSLYWGFYQNDLATGTFTKDEIQEIFRYFLYQYYAKKIGSNTPFYLCGMDIDGIENLGETKNSDGTDNPDKTENSDRTKNPDRTENPDGTDNSNRTDNSNELTRLILDAYMSLDINDPKIQILWHEDIPRDILSKIVGSIAKGRNSFVFVNEPLIRKALMKTGAKAEDAREVGIVGCYEPLCEGKEIACTCNGRIILPKAVEAVLGEGYSLMDGKPLGIKTRPLTDLSSFEDFISEVRKQIAYFADQTIRITKTFEKHYPDVNSAPVFAPLLADCMEKGMDPYAGGARYNNSSINVFGTATLVDELLAIKQLVYDDRDLSLLEFRDILKNNWSGHEALRQKALKKCRKYGNGLAEADALAAQFLEFSAKQINGKGNERGGVFRTGAFSIDWEISFGRLLAASADGRLHREPISKNMCAVINMDKNGVTALIKTVTGIDYSNLANGTVLDLMLHKTVFSDSDGISSVIGLLNTYMKAGGFALQINCFDPHTLREAQKDPDKYSRLQVRRCGWNVYFSELSTEEQNEFIKQAEGLTP